MKQSLAVNLIPPAPAAPPTLKKGAFNRRVKEKSDKIAKGIVCYALTTT